LITSGIAGPVRPLVGMFVGLAVLIALSALLSLAAARRFHAEKQRAKN
jgi:hypothetical protein